jgi:hypothetical protein
MSTSSPGSSPSSVGHGKGGSEGGLTGVERVAAIAAIPQPQVVQSRRAPDEPNFKYNDVVRGRDNRARLQGGTCKQCAEVSE